jgi:hypothetical protein
MNVFSSTMTKDERSPAYTLNCLERRLSDECPLKSRLETYVTTDGQSAILSWNKAAIWGLRPDFYYRQTVAGLLMWGAFSDEDGAVVYNCCWPYQRSHSGLATIFYCLRFVTSPFVASYDAMLHSLLRTTEGSSAKRGSPVLAET